MFPMAQLGGYRDPTRYSFYGSEALKFHGCKKLTHLPFPP